MRSRISIESKPPNMDRTDETGMGHARRPDSKRAEGPDRRLAAALAIAVILSTVAWAAFREVEGHAPMRPTVVAADRSPRSVEETSMTGLVEVVDGFVPTGTPVVYADRGFTTSGWIRTRDASAPPTEVLAVMSGNVVGTAAPMLAPDGLWRFTVTVPPDVLRRGAKSVRIDVATGPTTTTLMHHLRIRVR